jgi:PIN domain nuclease of toxin-antitoxin system
MSKPERLSPEVATALAKPGHELWFSPVTAWELALLAEKDRIELDPDVGVWMTDAITTLSLREAPVNLAVALESRKLSVETSDPADRFIAATAKVYEALLVTADRKLKKIPGQEVMFNTTGRRKVKEP